MINRVHHCRLCGRLCDKKCSVYPFDLPGLEQHERNSHVMSPRSKKRSLVCSSCHSLLTVEEAQFHRTARALTEGCTFQVEGRASIVQLTSQLDTLCIVDAVDPSAITTLSIEQISSVELHDAERLSSPGETPDHVTIRIRCVDAQKQPDVYIRSPDVYIGRNWQTVANQALSFHQQLRALGVTRK